MAGNISDYIIDFATAELTEELITNLQFLFNLFIILPPICFLFFLNIF